MYFCGLIHHSGIVLNDEDLLLQLGCCGRGAGPPLLLLLLHVLLVPEAAQLVRQLETVGEAGAAVEEDIGIVLGLALRAARLHN